MRRSTRRSGAANTVRKAAPAKLHRPTSEEIRRAAKDAARVAASQTDEDVEHAIAGDRDTFEAGDHTQLVAIRPGDVDVARIRSALGLTQAAFGAATGIPHRLISDWEQGRKKPSAAARAFLLLVDEFGEKALKSLARHAA